MYTKSQLYYERALKVTPGGVHSPVRACKNVETYPRFMSAGKGATIQDVDGNSYIDYCMSWGPLLLGHADETVRHAVAEGLSKGWSFGTAEEHSLKLAEFMTAELPFIEKVRFVNSGTEAVMTALRVARGYTGRSKIVKFDGCYHGHCDAMLVRAGSGLAEMTVPDSAGVPAATAADTLVAPLGDIEALKDIFDKHGSEIAAVIVEPVPANNGLLALGDEFLDQMTELARKRGSLVIFDEVITGFRLGFQGVAGRVRHKPDLLTYGKVIGGGFPVGACAGRAAVMDVLAPQGRVYQAGTLSANPVAMISGYETLKKIQKLNPYARLNMLTKNLAQMIAEGLKDDAESPVSVQLEGSIFWLVLGHVKTKDGVAHRPEDIPAQQKPVFAKVFKGLLQRGFYVAPSGYEVGFMSVAHDEDINARFAKAVIEVVKESKPF